MITLFSGTPGSGKSLMIASEILQEVRKKKRNVIACNMTIHTDYVIREGKNDAKVVFAESYQNLQHPFAFYEYAKKYHVKGKEGQTLICFDEVQELLGPDVCKVKGKQYVADWLEFFSQHRHLGFDVYFVTQYDRMIIACIRYLIEYNYVHRKVKRNGDFGMVIGVLLKLLFNMELFVQVKLWRGSRQKVGHKFFTYTKKFSKVYDSYKKFGDIQAAGSVSVPAAACGSVNFIEQIENLEVSNLIDFDKKKKIG